MEHPQYEHFARLLARQRRLNELEPLGDDERAIAVDGPDGDNRYPRKAVAAAEKKLHDGAAELLAHREYLQRRALDEAPASLWDFYVRRCARLSTRLHDMSLRAHTRPGVPLRSTQFAVLAVVRRTPSGEKLHEVARRAGIHRTTLSRSLVRLERLGFVRRDRIARDGRRRPVSLTEAGALALRLNLRRMEEAQLEIGLLVKDGFEGMKKLRDGLVRHFYAVRGALYEHDLHPEMYDDTPRGRRPYYADSTVRAHRR